jgi:hypothetical protein
LTLRGSVFIEFGNNIIYGQDVPGICNDNITEQFLNDATASVDYVLGPGPWSTPQQQEALTLLWHKWVDAETAAVALFNKHPESITGLTYVFSLLGVTSTFAWIASGKTRRTLIIRRWFP